MDTEDVQDWPHAFQQFDRISEFLDVYDIETDDDKQFLLMDLILASACDADPAFFTGTLWQQIEARLQQQRGLHG